MARSSCPCLSRCFLCIDTSTTKLYTLSLHDALPISRTASRTCATVRADGTSSSFAVPSVITSTGMVCAKNCEMYERSEEHTSELQSPYDLVCRLLLEKKKKQKRRHH